VKSIRVILISIFGVVMAHSALYADDEITRIRLNADYSAYRMQDDSTRAYVEIFYNLPRRDLDFAPDTLGYLAIIDFKITVMDSTGNAIDSASWKAGNRIDKLSVLNDSYFLISDMLSEVFPVGEYKILLEAKSGNRVGKAGFRMSIPTFSASSLSLSPLELAFEATRDESSKFSKGGYKILPNPSGQFSQSKNVVYLYAEGYNFDTAPEADSMYSLKIDILDPAGEIVRSLPESRYKKPGSSASIITGFSTATLPRDYFVARLTLSDGQNSVSSQKRFSVVASPERIRQEMLQALLDEFPEANKITNDEEAAKFRDDISFIARPDELKLYDSLNLEGKSNFQRDFWQARDPEPDTPENEFKLEHYRRLKYADEHYGLYKGFIKGWQTDRGRIYLLYGEPSEIERNNSTIENRAWERWWYDSIEGGVYFIFVDFEGTGAFQLVHSSKKDEIKDYNWEDKVKMTLFQR